MSAVDEWVHNANECIEIVQVNEKHEKDCQYHPSNTYAIFGDAEVIYGYKDLNVTITYECPLMVPKLEISYSERLAPDSGVEPTDIEGTLNTYLKDRSIKVEGNSFDVHSANSIHNYSFNGKTFKILQATVLEASEIMQHLQIFSLFFIEGGSFIDLNDPRWMVYLLYETTEDDYCLRGYCTVYKYYKWDKLIHDGIRARISQFVILPPFQHQGHGSQLYNAIVSTFLKNPKILDFTVEDASEAFDSLRDHCDYKRLLSMGIFSEPDFHPSLSRQWINSKIAETKLTQRQFSRCCELAFTTKLKKLSLLERKSVRLGIKERIFRQNLDVLLQLDKSERIEKIHNAYENQFDEYKQIVKKLPKLKEDSPRKRQKLAQSSS
ncbi:histone acetyltransferase Hat1 [Schizosaccharomyces pombe]|uniref:Histone acetyltransferase type B catalytic subunit n=1 Tax=Schizosaccharomyces pombe (strain 972 / ATCC 24843) TaxID=284812 RepID=HAT1_SCHPO|nr:histone acetyltransferase Hat1 [Schizosaccharomyces pombe]Q9UTM7.2 RecName: Full=Histone acetyltransferase type B catalytic subunit [Schizosaccharomyces pombe 972h-]CAB59620.2 histone acetyltransferase Hat1 [Schizosaccharomyces pombe]|eukprot:NP_593173.2 histone acetyltransferase Hat1 [Schizosaccharomyces pombe]